MIKVATSVFKRVSGDENLTLFNLIEDIRNKYVSGCGIYFCPSDAFGIDTLGKSLLLRKEGAIKYCIEMVSREFKTVNILIILGFLNSNSTQSCAVIQNGDVVFSSADFSRAFFTDGRMSISIKDVSDPKSHMSKTANMLFFVGSKAVCSSDYELLGSYIKYLSRETVSAVFYTTPDSVTSTMDCVYSSRNMDFSYYELLLPCEDGARLVDPYMLGYQASLNKKPVDIEGFNAILPVQSYKKDLHFPYSPLIDMEKGSLVSNYRACALNIANRMLASGSKKLIFGVSGGIDSTSTAILANEAIDILNDRYGINMSAKDIIAVSMPGLGTSKETLQNARNLCKGFNFTFYEIPIKRAVLSHFKDIKHDAGVHDVVFENAQARERTQILLDMANKYSALQLGTADLSEAVLGWCTFSGDQCAMYNTNLSFSKTQLQYILSNYAQMLRKSGYRSLADTIEKILSTPITPELLPLDENGEIKQKTEDSNGPYKVVDFLIYLYFYRGYDKDTCFRYLRGAFIAEYDAESLLKWCDNFEKRFLHSHFKRATSSQSPIVTNIGKIIYNIDMTSAPLV